MAEVAMASATAGLLVVALAGCGKPADSVQAPTTTATLGNDVDDAVVTARVKSALMADPKTNTFDIKIETRKGDVLLSGFVDSQDQIDQALRTTRAIEGVKSIQNHVTLKGASASASNEKVLKQ
jgi:hyperosmotically inducible protein